MATINVKLQDGSIQPLNFPDGMSDDQIQSAIHKEYGMPSAATEGNERPKFDDVMRQLGVPSRSNIGLGRQVSESAQNIGRGGQDFVEGLKQLFLTGAEQFGAVPKGTAKNYTDQAMQERKFYEEQMPAAKNPYARGARFIGANAPYAAPIGEVAATAELLPRILKGAATGGAIGGTQFVEHEQDRLKNILASAATGGVIPSVLAGASKLPGIAKTLFAKLEPKELVKGIQAKHDELLNAASSSYNAIKDAVKSRGIGKIVLPEDVFANVEDMLPKTRASKALVEKARSGDYDSLHQLQSDLGKKGQQNLSSDTYADRNLGEELMDARDKINEAIHNKFIKTGHEDLAISLKGANKQYRQLKNTYYSHPTVAKMVQQDLRKVPKNPLNTFSEDSVPMKKLIKAHPEINDALKLKGEKEKAFELLKKTGKGGAFGLPSAAALDYLLGKTSEAEKS